MTKQVEHLFTCVLVICIASFVKCLFSDFAHFSLECLPISYWVIGVLYVC